MKKLLVGALILSASMSSFAWGAREQGILIGAGSTLVIQEILNQRDARRDQDRDRAQNVYVYPGQQVLPPVWVQPRAPRYICGMNVVCPQQQGQTCLQHPIYDGAGNVVAFQLSCH